MGKQIDKNSCWIGCVNCGGQSRAEAPRTVNFFFFSACESLIYTWRVSWETGEGHAINVRCPWLYGGQVRESDVMTLGPGFPNMILIHPCAPMISVHPSNYREWLLSPRNSPFIGLCCMGDNWWCLWVQSGTQVSYTLKASCKVESLGGQGPAWKTTVYTLWSNLEQGTAWCEHRLMKGRRKIQKVKTTLLFLHWWWFGIYPLPR